jgi:hypothetical protein
MSRNVVGQADAAHFAVWKLLELMHAVERHVSLHGLNLSREACSALECHCHTRYPSAVFVLVHLQY